MGCCLPRQDKQVNPEAEFKTLEDERYSIIEEIFHIRDQEEAIETKELKTIVQKIEVIAAQDDLRRNKRLDGRSRLEETKQFAPERDCESYVLEDEVDPYGLALPLKTGDKMEAIPPENIR